MIDALVDGFREGWRASDEALRPSPYMQAIMRVTLEKRRSPIYEAWSHVEGYLSGRHRSQDVGFHQDGLAQFTIADKAACVASLPPELGPVVLIRPSLQMLADMQKRPHIIVPGEL